MNFENLLSAYFNSEGWHAIYKKYGGSVLSKENYRWKRIVKKRFGPNIRMEMRRQWAIPNNECFLLRHVNGQTKFAEGLEIKIPMGR